MDMPAKPSRTEPSNSVVEQVSEPFWKRKRFVIPVFFLTCIVVLGIVVMMSSMKKPKQNVDQILPSATPTKIPFTALPSVAAEPGELVVKFRPNQSPDTIKELLSELNLVSFNKLHNSQDPILSSYYLLKFPSDVDLNDVAKKLYSREEVEYVEPNAINQTF